MAAQLQQQATHMTQLQTRLDQQQNQRDSETAQLVAQVTSLREELEGERRRSEAAAVAAAAAAAAREAAPRSDAMNRVVGTRVIGKPDTFYSERLKFPDWSFIFKAYMTAVNPDYLAAFELVESAPGPLPNSQRSPRSKSLSFQL